MLSTNIIPGQPGHAALHNEEREAINNRLVEDALVMRAEMHGVKADPLINDSPALNTLLVAAASAGLPVRLAPNSVVKCVDPILVPSGTRLDLNGATLKHASTSASGRMLSLIGVSDVMVVNGTLDGDKDSFVGVTEQRHTLLVSNSHNFVLANLRCVNAKGDGVYIGDDLAGLSSDGVLINVVTDGCHRNGESITSAKRVRHYACAFLNSAGTNPQAGVDIEPNTDTATIDDITYDSCVFAGNVNDGFVAQAKSANPTSRQGGVRLTNCVSVDNGTNGIQVRWIKDFSWRGGESSRNGQRGVYLRDTLENLLFDLDVTGNAWQGYGQPQGQVTGLTIRGTVLNNGSAGATYDGIDLGGQVIRGTFDMVSGGNSRYGLRIVTFNPLSTQITIGASCRFPGNGTGATSLGDDQSTRVSLASEIGMRMGRPNPTDVWMAVRSAVAGVVDTIDRINITAAGKMSWSSGTSALDVTLERSAPGVLAVGPLHMLRTGRGTTAQRPNPVTAGEAAEWYDRDLKKTLTSDGTIWRDAMGGAV